ncbi:MAG: Bax inhibitor-1/YccA family protein [Candidatus Gastranaerophilales bacterium]|nr:Bax inhibitor-1/YccA family protein [Candidatus Gastranaerophilales bacterium]
MSNPALNENVADKFVQTGDSLEQMSISGTAIKTVFLLAVIMAASFYSFGLVLQGFIDKALMIGQAAIFAALGVGFFIVFNKNIKWTAPLSICYAALEGLAIGGISAVIGSAYSMEIVVNAVCATFVTLFVMLFLYSAKIIRCTEKFSATIIAATFAILVIYLVTLVLSFIKPESSSMLMQSTPVGILFSAFVCSIAALNFIIDFSTIERLKARNLSKDFEWYGAFSLMVTIVWLYIEILKLFVKFNSRR